MSPRRASPPATAQELLAQLRAAGLLSARQAGRLASGWDGGDPPARVAELVAAGLLTPFQAERVLAGRTRRLRLGPYLLLDRLGAGGTGRVYKAEHRLMKRVVALKVLGALRPHPLAVSRRASAAFRREARASARLAHPHIVTAFDAGRARGRLFLVTEYVDGIDLERLVAQAGPLPLHLAWVAVRQTALALQYLHERRLLHRDVKPANIMLVRCPTAGFRHAAREAPAAEEIEVKLLDLGLVRRAGKGRPTCGTPDYMAPECGGDGGPPDIRADLYSLGCTFFHLLTGQVPFPGGGWPAKLLRHHLDSPPPLRTLRPDVPDAVAAVVERLMARDTAARYATPANLVAALDACPLSPPAPAPAPPRLPRTVPGVLPSLAAVVVGVLLACAARVASSGWEMVWRARSVSDRTGARAPVANAVSAAPSSPKRATSFKFGSEACASQVRIEVSGLNYRFANLADAVAAAPDGATLTLHADGKFATAPLSWSGKALTLRAAPGVRPRLVRAPSPEPTWNALLDTDRDLALHGVDLADGPADSDCPLVSVAGGALHVTGCGLRGVGRAPLLALRRGTELRLLDCRLDATAVAVSVEVGPAGRCRLGMEKCTVRVRDASGVAVSLWAAEGARAPVDLRFQASTLTSGRVVACRALPASLAVRAAGNTFSYTSAFFNYDGYPDPAGWRATTWHGRGNRFPSSGPWVRVDGRPIFSTDAEPAARFNP
jgi:serine/threonine-protein kinase